MTAHTEALTNVIRRQHFMQIASVLLFVAFCIGMFVTRGHAIVAGVGALLLFIFCPKPFAMPKFSAWVWLFVAAFIAAMGTITALFSLDPRYALGAAAGVAGFIFIGLILWDRARYFSHTECEKLYDYSRIAMRVSIILLTILLMSPGLIAMMHPSQVGESVMNRTIVALVLLAGVYIAASVRRRHVGGAWVMYFWMVGLAFLSDSETAKLVVLLAPFTYGFMHVAGGFGRIAASLLVVAYTFSAPFLAGPFFTWVQNLPLSSATFRGAFGARAEIWDAVAQVVLRQPLTGYGVESTRLMKNLPIKGIFWPEKVIAHPHNAALQIWVDMGVGGAAILAIAFVALLMACRHLKRQEAAATQTLILMVFCIFQVSHGMWQSWWLGLLGLVGFLTHALVVNGGMKHVGVNAVAPLANASATKAPHEIRVRKVVVVPASPVEVVPSVQHDVQEIETQLSWLDEVAPLAPEPIEIADAPVIAEIPALEAPKPARKKTAKSKASDAVIVDVDAQKPKKAPAKPRKSTTAKPKATPKSASKIAAE